jgi:hypothetical protein
VPLLAIIFLMYFGLPSAGVELSIFEAGALSLIVFYAAYLSEIFRGAIGGVHSGQQEAASALGLSRLTTFTHAVLPQALRIADVPRAGGVPGDHGDLLRPLLPAVPASAVARAADSRGGSTHAPSPAAHEGDPHSTARSDMT